MIIKICGMRDADNIREVAALGIDWMGFDFRPDSPRYVQQISSRAGIIPDYSSLKDNQVAESVKRVGVFADDMPQNIVTRVYNYQLDIVQLQGDERAVMIDNLRHTLEPDIRSGVKVMKVIRVHDAADLQQCQEFESVVDYFLFDLSATDSDGSTTQTNWNLLENYKGKVPFLLGGALGAADVARILAFRHPQFVGVNLNSCFESAPAVKDVALLQTTINQLRKTSDTSKPTKSTKSQPKKNKPTDNTKSQPTDSAKSQPTKSQPTDIDTSQLPWIAIRLSYLKQQQIDQFFKDNGLETFIPMQYDLVASKTGKPNRVLRPVVRNLLFVKKSLDDAQLYKLMEECPYSMFAIRKNRESRDLYEIPSRQMFEFRQMCNPEIELREYLSEEEAKLKPGAPVLVKFGPLKGMTGRLVRKSKKYYLLKEVPGMGVMLKISRWCCVPLEE